MLRDKEGKPYSVRYDQVMMLLNEFLKEHRAVQELKREIAALTRRMKEQDAKIQKVSDQSELNKAAPQMVNNDEAESGRRSTAVDCAQRTRSRHRLILSVTSALSVFNLPLCVSGLTRIPT